MNQAATRVLRHITGEKNLETVSLQKLQDLAKSHPYFPVAHFLLAKKLKAENAPAFEKQAQRTAIYYHNILWLDYQLTKEKYTELVFDEKEVIAHTQEIAEVIDVPAEEIIAASELAHQTLGEQNLPIAEPETVFAPTETIIEEEDDKRFQRPVLETTDAETIHVAPETVELEEQPALNTIKDDQSEDVSTEPIETVAEFVKDQNEILDVPNEPTETFNNTIQHTDVVTETAEEMAGATTSIDDTTEAFLAEVEEPSNTDEPATAGDNETGDLAIASAEENVEEENQEPESETNAGEPDEHERMYQSIKAMLDATTDEANSDTNAEVPIDPYFTIDYFASQGIKLEFDPNPQDKLGQHLKKFTQWLRHMKKLGPEDAQVEIIDGEAEADIKQIADTSNTAKEVVTEAMAAVLEKQGKKAKAIELYNKLSFLYPHKTVYFADKIKNLKGF